MDVARDNPASSIQNMKLDYIGCCFRITVEFFRRESALAFRKYRVEPGSGEYEARRKLLRDVRAKLKEPVTLNP